MHVLSDGLRIQLKEISREKMSRNLNVFTRATGNFPSKQGDREKKGVSDNRSVMSKSLQPYDL